jgi:membrane-bound lytic murein transglycosylase F
VGLGRIILVRMIGRRVAPRFVAGVLGACTQAPKPIAPVAQSGELVVLTLNGPVTYFEDAQGLPSGFEYDLVQLFARELGAKPAFVVIDDPNRPDLQGRAHVAASGLARHFDYPGGLAWGPPYHDPAPGRGAARDGPRPAAGDHFRRGRARGVGTST